MNNIALDVAIGLTFTYLLYSLLATTIKEILATIFSYRSKMLERGLQQMLDGENVNVYWWNKKLKPAHPEDSKTPVNALTQKQAKIQSFFATSVTSHPIYRRSGEKTLTRKPSYLSSSTFSDIMIDIFHPDKSGPVLLKNVKAEVENKLTNGEINKDLHNILNIYLQQANGDVQRFRWLMENWFDDMMDRVSGWYKRRANWILLVIGFIMALVFNASTIDIVNKLSSDKDARNALVQSASEYLRTQVTKVDTLSAAKKETATDNPRFMADVRLRLKQIDSLYTNDIAKSNSIIGAGWPDVREAGDSVKRGDLSISKIGSVVGETFSSPRKWLGFLITALAISLGAPFWFDLLNKFINLRVAGKKPDDSSDKQVATKSLLLNQIPDASAIG